LREEFLKEKKVILKEEDIEKTLKRLASQVVESVKDLRDLIIVGIKTRGVPLAERICKELKRITGLSFPTGALDITFYRDDFSLISLVPQVKGTSISTSIDGKIVLLVDDVLYTGRTIRAAIDELLDYGRPSSIRLLVLVDRGSRELPICPDFVGLKFPLLGDELIVVKLKEVDGVDEVVVAKKEESS